MVGWLGLKSEREEGRATLWIYSLHYYIFRDEKEKLNKMKVTGYIMEQRRFFAAPMLAMNWSRNNAWNFFDLVGDGEGTAVLC